MSPNRMNTVPSSIWCRAPHLIGEACGHRTWAATRAAQRGGSGDVTSISRRHRLDVYLHLRDRRPAGQPGDQRRVPGVLDHPDGRELLGRRVLKPHRVQDDRGGEARDGVHLWAHAAVREGQRAHHRVRQMGFALERAERPHQGVGDPVRRVGPGRAGVCAACRACAGAGPAWWRPAGGPWTGSSGTGCRARPRPPPPPRASGPPRNRPCWRAAHWRAGCGGGGPPGVLSGAAMPVWLPLSCVPSPWLLSATARTRGPVRRRTACQGVCRGANHLIRPLHRRYLPVDS